MQMFDDMLTGRIVDPEDDLELPPGIEAAERGISVAEVLRERGRAGVGPQIAGRLAALANAGTPEQRAALHRAYGEHLQRVVEEANADTERTIVAVRKRLGLDF